MTINISFSTVADSISHLSISGVNIKDANEIPAKAEANLPVLFSRPVDFISDLSVTRVSMGSGGTAQMDGNYTLNYVFLHSVVGASGGVLSQYSDFLSKLALIIVSILGNDNITGALDMQLQGISNLGPLVGPNGTNFLGVEIALRVMEIVQ